jgi:hypothetical protein
MFKNHTAILKLALLLSSGGQPNHLGPLEGGDIEPVHPDLNTCTRLEMCTLWSTLKFQRCSSWHITGDDISKETNRITNATMVSNTTMTTKDIVAIRGMRSLLQQRDPTVTSVHIVEIMCSNNDLGLDCCNNVFQKRVERRDIQTDRDRSIRCYSLMLKREEHLIILHDSINYTFQDLHD